MKRIAAILTSLVLVFSLAACGSQQAGTAAGSEAAVAKMPECDIPEDVRPYKL